MDTSDASDAWRLLFDAINKSQKTGLPDVWAWSKSRGPADHSRIQMRRELVAADLEEGKYVTTRSIHTLRRVSTFIPPTADAMRAARAALYGESNDDSGTYKSQISCNSASSHSRCRAAFSSGCVPFHGIPIRLPEHKKDRSFFSPPQKSKEVVGDLNVPDKYKRWVSLRNNSIEDIPEVCLDESMRFAATKAIDLRRKQEMLAALSASGSKQPKRRDDGMAAALQKVVANHRSTLEKPMQKPKIVMFDLDADAEQEMLNHITTIQRAFRSRKMNALRQEPERFFPSKHRTAFITTEQVKELKKESDKEKEKNPKKVPVRWERLQAMREKRDKSSELPLPGVDEVWDCITRRYGGIRSHATLVDIVDLFHSCKLAGLNIDLARFPGLWPARNVEPEDVSPGEVAHLCIMLLEDTHEELTCEQVREEITCVKEECRATEYKDLYIGNDDSHEYINFSHFRRLVHFLSDLMAIDEHYILGTFMYLCTGTFEMTDLFAALVMKEMGKKHKWKGKKKEEEENHPKRKKAKEKAKSKDESTFEGCAVEDIQNLLSQKFSNVDFSRMCYNCEVLDIRHGVTYSRCGETFLQTVKHMGKLMKDRVAKRPILHKDEAKWEDMMMKYDTPSFLLDGSLDDKNIACCFTIGRSEFCILVEALYGILPKSWFGGPLDMCLKLVLKIRARDYEKFCRAMLRCSPQQSSPGPSITQQDSSGNLKVRTGKDTSGNLNRSRSPSEQGKNSSARRNRSSEQRNSSRSPSARSSVSSRHSSRSRKSEKERSVSPVRNPNSSLAGPRLEVPEAEQH